MNTQPITDAVVEQPVSGAVSIGINSLNSPTPVFVRTIVRSLTWITAIWAIISLSVDFTDFGMSEATETLIVKYSASFTGLVSVLARFVGVKPVNLTERN